MINDLRDFIAKCEKEGEFKRVKAEVDWNLELSHVAKLSEEKDGPVLLFENVKGYDTPVVTSIFTKTTRMAMVLDMPANSTIFEMSKKWVEAEKKGGIPPKKVNTGPIMENQQAGDEVDILSFPIPRYLPDDVGRFFGTAVSVITKDPETGFMNLGCYRMEVLDKKSLGCNFVKGKDAEIMLQKYRTRNELMPCAAAIGGDPRLLFVSGSTLPYGTGEYDIAGALRGKPVEVIESEVTGLPIPAHAEIVAEGFINPDPKSYRNEGPFGEYTGYYSGARSPKPWLDIKRILYREQPIFWAELIGRPPSANVLIHALAKTATLWTQLNEMGVPGISSVCFPPSSGRFWAVVSVKQMYPGHARQVGLAALGTVAGHYGVKGIIVVDDDIRADDWERVLWALSVRYNPATDTEIITGTRSTPLDPALPIGQRNIGSQIIMDATIPFHWDVKPKMAELDKTIVEKVKKRWHELGFE
jgi:4-hydroxy-3-polyprenylbenzoate decarboxylase